MRRSSTIETKSILGSIMRPPVYESYHVPSVFPCRGNKGFKMDIGLQGFRARDVGLKVPILV